MPDQTTIEEDLIARWERAVKFAAYVRAEWEAQDSPLLAEWANLTISEHPICKLMREAEKDAARLARDVAKPGRRIGRPPVAAPASISESPASRLRRQRLTEEAGRARRRDVALA